ERSCRGRTTKPETNGRPHEEWKENLACCEGSHPSCLLCGVHVEEDHITNHRQNHGQGCRFDRAKERGHLDLLLLLLLDGEERSRRPREQERSHQEITERVSNPPRSPHQPKLIGWNWTENNERENARSRAHERAHHRCRKDERHHVTKTIERALKSTETSQ